MRRPTITLVLVVALGVLGAACGKSSSSHTGAASPTTAAASVSPAVVADLAPTGTLRLAVPAAPPFLAHGNPPAGIAVALATALAGRLGVPLTTTVYPNPPAVLAAAHGPGWDIAVLPMMPATTAAVDFSGPVLLLPHTLLVRTGSTIQTLAQADQPGVRIASEAAAPHTPVLAGQLHHATLVPVGDTSQGLAMPNDQAQVPGATVLSEDFFTARFGIAAAKGHPVGLAWLSTFVEQLKASGAVKRAIDSAQLSAVNVAPPGA